MTTEIYSGTVARVKAVELGSAADRLGLLVGDIILKLGKHEALEGVETPSVLDDIRADHDWLVIKRESVIFRLASKGGAFGATLEAYPLPEDITLDIKGPWEPFHCSIRPNDSMLLIPEKISPIWWPFPLIAYGYFRLWQMLGATLFLYCIGLATSEIAFAVVYIASILILITGGPHLLRDTAVKDGFSPRGRIALGDRADIANLEMVTKAMLRVNHKGR